MPDILLLIGGVFLAIFPWLTYGIDGYYKKAISLSSLGMLCLIWEYVGCINIEPKTTYSEITTLDTPEGKVQVTSVNGKIYNVQDYFSYFVDTEKYVFRVDSKKKSMKYGIVFVVPNDKHYLVLRSDVK